MSKVIVRTPNGVSPRQINFANPKAKEKMERSVKGAIHFVGGATKIITTDELEYIKEFHKSFFKTLIVIYSTESAGKPKTTLTNVNSFVSSSSEDFEDGLDSERRKNNKKK